ncbi:MAG: MFS transporter [Pseudomonadales bacterium]
MGVFYGYRLVAYSFVVCFLATSFFLHARGVFFPYWMADFQVSKTELSAVVTATLFSGAMFAPIMGYLIDHLRVKWIVTVASLWLCAGYLLMQWVESYWGLILVLIPFQGLGWTGVGPLVHTKLMVNWFSRNRGMALGFAIMGMSVAGVVVPPINAFLAETIGWRNAYLIYVGLLVGLVIPATLLLVRQHPSELGQHPDGIAPAVEGSSADNSPAARPRMAPDTQGWAVYREVLTNPAFWSVVLTFGLMNGVYSAMATHLPTYMSTELNFTIVDAAWLLSLAGGFAIGGKIVFGWMMDHLPAKITVLSGVVAYIGSTLAILSGASFATLSVAAALFGLGFGGMVPVRSVVISRIFGAARFSRANGLLSFFIAPATFWVLITGYVADQAGSYLPAFQIWCGAFLLAGVVSLIVKIPNADEAVA